MTKKRKSAGLEISQPIMEEKPKQSNEYVYDEYYDYFTFRMKPVSDQWINNLAHELLDWAANNDNALKITQFYHLKGIGSNDIKRWSERNKNLSGAHTRALQMIGNRRETGALKGKLKEGMVAYSMPMYDKNWEKLVEWRASLKDKNEEKSIKVLVEQIPSSDLVPPKKKEEE